MHIGGNNSLYKVQNSSFATAAHTLCVLCIVLLPLRRAAAQLVANICATCSHHICSIVNVVLQGIIPQWSRIYRLHLSCCLFV